MIRIAVVDDHRLVGHSLKTFLESFADLQVVGVASSGEELLESAAAWNPGVVLMDLLIPGGMDGIETTRRLRRRFPDARVVALTASTDEPRLVGVMRAGASAYVRKGSDPETLLTAIRAVAQGGVFIDPAAGAAWLRAAAEESLTPREIDVLRQVAIGRSNREIAGALAIGEETVKSHVASLLGKLEAENRAQIIGQALKKRLISMEDFERS